MMFAAVVVIGLDIGTTSAKAVVHPGHEIGRAAAMRLVARPGQPGLSVERGSGELRP